MIVTVWLEAEDLARIDALAVQRGVTREEMLAVLVYAGLPVCEQEAAGPPESQRRMKAGTS